LSGFRQTTTFAHQRKLGDDATTVIGYGGGDLGAGRDSVDPEATVAMILDGLRSGRGDDEVAAAHGTDPATYAAWRDCYLAGGRAAVDRRLHHIERSGRLPHLGTVPHVSSVPAWLRQTRGEARLPVVLAVVIAIVLQAVLPDKLAVRPTWLLPALEAAALVGLTIFNPLRMNRTHPIARFGGLGLCALIVLANAYSALRLIHAILVGHGSKDPTVLFGSGASIYVTNIVAFALLYWELDRGGPVARAGAHDPHPDFMFPQMATPDVGHPDWEPTFVDYAYLSFTNATAFSPTDTMPLTRWAKALMTVQSAVALAVVGLVVARAVNILS
jgi:hypothetical protein